MFTPDGAKAKADMSSQPHTGLVFCVLYFEFLSVLSRMVRWEYKNVRLFALGAYVDVRGKENKYKWKGSGIKMSGKVGSNTAHAHD